jgi:F0F1-type ATP synthase epsilon subunit
MNELKTTTQKPAINKQMYVKVYAPYKVYYDGQARSVSASNRTGPFDILSGHHNFISLLDTCEIIIRTDRGEEKIKIDRGIMHVRADQIIVFLDV